MAEVRRLGGLAEALQFRRAIPFLVRGTMPDQLEKENPMRVTLFAVCLALGAPSLGCEQKRTDDTPAQTETRTDIERETADPNLEAERSELRERADRALSRAEEAIERLEKRAEDAPEEARQGYDEALSSLREARDETKQAYERATASSGDTWEETKRETDEALGELESSYNTVLERMKTDERQAQ